jgi:hypothetical protein
VVSAAERTLTLKFIAPAVTVHGIDQIDLLGPEGNLEVDLKPMFTVSNGAMVAVDAAKVIAIMRAHAAGPLVVMAQAWEKRGVIHASRVEFRIE